MITTQIQLPVISQLFKEDIEKKAKEGVYEKVVDGIKITVFPYVFPPASPFSESTHSVYDEFGDLRGKTVLDIGTGTGIQAIKASLAGAKIVDAVDIFEVAIDLFLKEREKNDKN